MDENPDHRPRRFRLPCEGNLHPNGTMKPFLYGAYFPATDLCVTDMGNRSTGVPRGHLIEWLDDLKTGEPVKFPVDTLVYICSPSHELFARIGTVVKAPDELHRDVRFNGDDLPTWLVNGVATVHISLLRLEPAKR